MSNWIKMKVAMHKCVSEMPASPKSSKGRRPNVLIVQTAIPLANVLTILII